MATSNGITNYAARVTERNFVTSAPRKTIPVTVKTGEVLKAFTFLESTTDGKSIAHSGIVEKGLVTFPTKIDAAETVIIGGLTFLAGAAEVSKATLVAAWSGLTAGMTAAQANAANPVTGGSFSAGTLGAWNTFKSSTADSVLFVNTTPYAGVTDLAVTGTGDASTVTVVALAAPQKPIQGLLAFDVDASGADVEASAYVEATLWEEAIVWNNDPAADTITLSDTTTKAVTDYHTGCLTDAVKRKFLEGSAISIVIPKAGEL